MPGRHTLKTALAIALLMVSRARAQSSDQIAPGNAPSFVRSNCTAFLPQNAAYSGAQAPTLVSVRITPDGEMRDPTLFQSSGDSERDRAALACADGYHIGYVSVRGRPTEVHWVLANNLTARGSNFGPAHPPGAQNKACKSSSRPERIPNASTTVSYRIATDGTVTNATVQHSSGVSAYDSAVVRCVSSWRFFPVMLNGQPVEADQSLQVNWGNDTGAGTL
ncbi:MAG TPA: energy transducer TonB [Rhizomicrobium sp.]|nr:energy transducer TonB [Rhizomicrobium sp.]